eukprot:6160221-Prorocentrum_lima.AAC.1
MANHDEFKHMMRKETTKQAQTNKLRGPTLSCVEWVRICVSCGGAFILQTPVYDIPCRVARHVKASKN